MKRIVVFGGVGTGMTIASIVEHDPNAVMLGFLNDSLDKGAVIGEFKKFPVIGKTSDVEGLLEEPDVYFAFGYTAMRKGKESFVLSSGFLLLKNNFQNRISS